MSTVRASAPGKIFLLGEYAVLGGAPALLTAANQRAVVTATDAEAWTLTTAGIGVDPVELESDGSLPRGIREAPSPKLVLFDEVHRSVDAHFGAPGEPQNLVIDSTPFQRNGNKLGLGSSAAVAVALTAALIGARGKEPDLDTVFRLADAGHRAAQGGSGSGGDIAASVHGGVIRYRRRRSPEAVKLPEGLGVLAVATGAGSSTVELVARVAEYEREQPDAYNHDMDTLRRFSELTASALPSVDGMLSLVDDYFYALEALAQHSGAEIVTERHRELRRLAAASGAIFKPSGAGGGDLGLVFGKLEAVDAIQSTLTEGGALVIPVPTDSDGVKVERA